MVLEAVHEQDFLDTWFAREVLGRLQRRARLFRYAYDAILFFESEHDARRVLAGAGSIGTFPSASSRRR